MTFNKQIALSITGLSIMLVLLLGVSYSFFNYSQATDNNMITTGNIVFDFDKKDSIILMNQFPISYEEMLKEDEDNPDNNALIIKFKVKGYNTLANGMNYRIKLLLDKKYQKEDLFDDSIIFAQISFSQITAGYSVTDYGVNEDMTFGPRGTGSPLTGINTGKEITILTGNIHTAAVDASQSFEIRIWIDSRKVLISDTVNRDDNNKAIAVDNPEKELVAASDEDVGKIVYRTDEFSKKIMAIEVKAENY